MRRLLGRPILAAAATLAALVLAAGACDDSTTEPGNRSGGDSGGLLPGHSLVSVWLTDAPGDIAEAWVQIDAIYLQARDGDDDTDGNGNGNGNGNGEQNGRVFLLEDPTGWINLIELEGETLSLVEGILIPGGTYSQLRFVLGEALLVTEGGSVYATPGADVQALNDVRTDLGLDPLEGADGTLHCPSCSQSGLKVKLPNDQMEIADDSEIILLDFDVSQSFGHIAGRSGRWIMHPVIFATDFDTDGEFGGIAGTVALDTDVTLPDCGGGALDITVFVPIARMNGTERTTSVANDGSYAFDLLAPGDWEMDFAATIDFTNGEQLVLEATPDPATATVTADATTTVDYTITSATCNAGS